MSTTAGTTLSEAISSVIQILLFTLIPFIVWLILARKKENFFIWIGLKGIGNNIKDALKYALLAFAICEVVGIIANETIMKELNVSLYAGKGFSYLLCIMLYAYLHTALSEEILYRGFIQKRLQNKLGFWPATIIQAFIFGLTHLLMALGQVNFAQGLVLLLYPMVPGILIPYVNEKKANGSILLGVLIHGTLNFIVQLSQL